MSAGARRRGPLSRAAWSEWPCLIVLLVAFFVGAVAGVSLALFKGSNSALYDYLYEYCVALSQGQLRPSFLSVLWDCVRWPLLTVALGITVLGIVGIPVVFAARGFLLSFSVVTFGMLLGQQGIAIASVLFSVTVLFVLPTLFVVGCDWLRVSCMRLPGGVPSAGGGYRIESMLVCAGALAVSAAVQWTIVPAVLAAVCSRIVL